MNTDEKGRSQIAIKSIREEVEQGAILRKEGVDQNRSTATIKLMTQGGVIVSNKVAEAMRIFTKKAEEIKIVMSIVAKTKEMKFETKNKGMKFVKINKRMKSEPRKKRRNVVKGKRIGEMIRMTTEGLIRKMREE